MQEQNYDTNPIVFNQENEVNIISPNEYTEILNFLPWSENILNYERDKENCENIINNGNVIFTLDFNSLGRARNLSSLISKSSATTMSQSTARQIPSLVARPNPTIRLPLQRVMTTELFANKWRNCL